MSNGWIGVDLDGTLAYWDEYSPEIGEPIPMMVNRVKQWLMSGWEVRIVTARATMGPSVVSKVEQWCELHIGYRLRVTCQKDEKMVELWDDRAVQVERNKGLRSDGVIDYYDNNDIGVSI